MRFPAPWDGIARPGVLAEHTLLLQRDGRGNVWPLLDPEIDPTFPGLWVEMDGTPLAVPALAEQQRRFALDWRTKVVFTPASIGHPFGGTVHARIGWAILARLDRFEGIAHLGLLASVFECRGRDPQFQAGFAVRMGLPRLYRNKLLTAARAGQPIVDPKALRWMLTELAAADDAELDRLAQWRPAPGSDDELAVRALAPFLFGNRSATWEQFRLAVWLLGDSFHGAGVSFADRDGILGGVTAVGYVTCEGDGWHSLLDRWAAVWAVPDTHRAVQGCSEPPSAVRKDYETALGLDPVSWLTGVSFVALRWWMSFRPDAMARGIPFPLGLEEVTQYGAGVDAIELSDEFRVALRKHLVISVEDFCAEVQAKRGAYGGIGSLPQHDQMSCRNHPILELPNGMLAPMSLNLIGERAAVLHRWLLNKRGARHAAGRVGHMFEAYIDDVVATTSVGGHRVLSEAEITSVLGSDTRCDLAVVNGTEWLFIESSVQTIARTVAEGDVAGIDALCLRYHDEADQAEATAARAAELAAAYNLPKATSTAYVVVVDNSAPHSPALMARMHELRPGRNPRFVVSAGELEGLAALARLGWSLPGAVHRWRSQTQEGPISTVSAGLARLIRPAHGLTREELDRWVANLPIKRPPEQPSKAA